MIGDFMTEQEQRNAAVNFSAKWTGHGDEKSDTQEFWTTLLNEILGVDKPFDVIKFNQPIKYKFQNTIHSGECDAIIKSTKVLIEQKDYTVKNLDKKYPQSDGAILTPFEQAKRYVEGYNDEKEHLEDCIKWVVVCNFSEFRIYDVRSKDSLSPDFENNNPVVTFRLRELHENIKYLKFLVDPNDDTLKAEVQISKTAAVIINDLYIVKVSIRVVRYGVSVTIFKSVRSEQIVIPRVVVGRDIEVINRFPCVVDYTQVAPIFRESRALQRRDEERRQHENFNKRRETVAIKHKNHPFLG